jgi:hypothetical protein
MRSLLSELCNVSIISWKTAIDRSPTCCNGVISQSGHRETNQTHTMKEITACAKKSETAPEYIRANEFRPSFI